jgi:hypothetical protein
MLPALCTRCLPGDSASIRVWCSDPLTAPASGNEVRTRHRLPTAPARQSGKTPQQSAPGGSLPLDKWGPSKEQLLMWERRPSRNLGKFLAVARPRSGINTLIRVRCRACTTPHLRAGLRSPSPPPYTGEAPPSQATWPAWVSHRCFGPPCQPTGPATGRRRGCRRPSSWSR